MTVLFDLDDEEADRVTDALLRHADQGIMDLQNAPPLPQE